MSDQCKDDVRRQFGASAPAYATSSVHAKGADLPLLPAIAALTGSEDVLDIATAAGHTALALAPHARHVTGVDLTPEMLTEAKRLVAERGVANVAFQEADAEALPFGDGTFDVVTCRIAAHHFPDVAAFCREAARVLRPGGRLLVVDNVAPEDQGLDRFINTVEKLRDPSHYRCHSLSEWQRYMADAGLCFAVAHQFITPMDREDWLARANTPADVAGVVRRILTEAPAEAREAFAITPTHFQLHKAIMVGHKAAAAGQ
ncbi:MAG TPA: class I SAM-dependent methyltransferase [Symbiobacteriaceae bacterium]|nr:class I SAM-dependent methyltransferase [Symbiobacteriaceae bacterium]